MNRFSDFLPEDAAASDETIYDSPDERRDDATDREAEEHFAAIDREAERYSLLSGMPMSALHARMVKRAQQRHLLEGQRAEVTDAAVAGEDSLWNVYGADATGDAA